MNAATDLITIETLKAADVFKPGAVEKLICDVEQKVRAMPPSDHTTEKGRNEIKGLAYKVTRSKTALDDMGKNFVAELKKAAGVVDADRRIIRERLEALKDEVRKPVTEYEEQEEIRIDAHKANMETLQGLDTFAAGEDTINGIDSRRLTLSGLCGLDWQEFSDGARRLISKMDASLNALRAKLVEQEAQKAELERLRKAEAEREAAERKAIAEQEQRDHDAEITARAVRDTEERNAAVAAAKEQERQAAIARAEKAERDHKAAIAAALADASRRAAEQKAAEGAATKKREADKAHLMKINNAALSDLVKVTGIQEQMGKAVIIAIASGKIANVNIIY